MMDRPQARSGPCRDPEAPSRLREWGISSFVYRYGAAGSALAVFLFMSWLYVSGDNGLYETILNSYGIIPFRFPFVDTSGGLAAWECAWQGIDVIVSDPCDVLQRGYTYSPLWMSASGIPLGVGDTNIVGCILDLVFIMSLWLLPPPRRLPDLIITVAATLSTMVVFALERANPDILLFMLALAAGLLSEGWLPMRLFGYCLGLTAALVKYYPVMILIVAFREQPLVLGLAGLAVVSVLAFFFVEYHAEIARGMPNIPRGPIIQICFRLRICPFF
jgi:hypothetical protein